MMPRLVRLGLVVLLLTQLPVALWQAVLPRHFYDNFPTVSHTPPYSEHLMRDFGFAGLSIAVILAAAVIWPTVRMTLVALVAYLVFALPHAAFHMVHLDESTAAFLLTSLGSTVGLAIVLLIATLAGRGSARAEEDGVGARQ